MSNNMVSPTVYGVETEYSCTITYPNDVVYEFVDQCHQANKTVELYLRPKQKNVDDIPNRQIFDALYGMGIISVESTNMLSNGGRFYIDPSGPEYCTPETTTAEEATLRTFDGDRILFGVLMALQEKEAIKSFQINRRIVDHNRSSRGIHLNTATKFLDTDLTTHQLSALMAMNVVKGAIFGSGGLLLNDRGQTEFHHSPRLSITSDTVASYLDYSRRPLVRVPFKSDVGINRVETVTSDALNFAWPLRASLVATNALFKLFELGYDKELPTLRHPVRAAHVVGKLGAYCRISVEVGLDEYKAMSPLSVLRRIVELTIIADEKHSHLDPESKQVLDEITLVSDLVEGKHDAAATQVESIARKREIDKKIDASGKSIGSETICRYDFYWDKIGGGLAEKMREKGAGWLGFTKTHNSVIETDKRLTEPPNDTRALIRGRFVKIHGPAAKCSDWSKIKQENGAEVLLAPLQTTINNNQSN